MSNYNEALEDEKRTLSLLVETDFYPSAPSSSSGQPSSGTGMASLLEKITTDPELSAQLLQQLLNNAVNRT